MQNHHGYFVLYVKSNISINQPTKFEAGDSMKQLISCIGTSYQIDVCTILLIVLVKSEARRNNKENSMKILPNMVFQKHPYLTLDTKKHGL
jgi:hypothetical protein